MYCCLSLDTIREDWIQMKSDISSDMNKSSCENWRNHLQNKDYNSPNVAVIEIIHPITERVSQLRILYVGCFRLWSFQKTRNVVCLELYTEGKYYLQLNAGEPKFAAVSDSFCVMVQLWCLFLTLNSRARRSRRRLESSCGICVMGLSLPSYSHFHISQSPVEFYGAAGKKNKTKKNFWGLPRRNG